MEWHSPWTKPPKPDVYRVRVPVPGPDSDPDADPRYARWTGDYWCSWAVDAKRAAMCVWRGPSAGYLWTTL